MSTPTCKHCGSTVDVRPRLWGYACVACLDAKWRAQQEFVAIHGPLRSEPLEYLPGYGPFYRGLGLGYVASVAASRVDRDQPG